MRVSMSVDSSNRAFFEYKAEAAKLRIISDLTKATIISKSHGYQIASNPKELLEGLKNKQATSFIIDKNFTKSIYDITVQYAGSLGLIQYMEKESMELEDIYFDKEEAQLLFIATEQEIKEIENKFPFLDKIALVERT